MIHLYHEPGSTSVYVLQLALQERRLITCVHSNIDERTEVEALALAATLCEMHNAPYSVVHRDVSPNNIYRIPERGVRSFHSPTVSNLQVMIADFGFAVACKTKVGSEGHSAHFPHLATW